MRENQIYKLKMLVTSQINFTSTHQKAGLSGVPSLHSEENSSSAMIGVTAEDRITARDMLAGRK